MEKRNLSLLFKLCIDYRVLSVLGAWIGLYFLKEPAVPTFVLASIICANSTFRTKEKISLPAGKLLPGFTEFHVSLTVTAFLLAFIFPLLCFSLLGRIDLFQANLIFLGTAIMFNSQLHRKPLMGRLFSYASFLLVLLTFSNSFEGSLGIWIRALPVEFLFISGVAFFVTSGIQIRSRIQNSEEDGDWSTDKLPWSY